MSHARSERTQGRAQQGQLQQELVASRKAVLGWAAERENLAADAERLRKAHDAISADNQALQARITAQEAQLTTLHEEREQLSALYTNVTNQTKRLAADWSVRRDGLTADKQRLASELEEARTTLTLSQERDRQWKAQVWKLQDEVKTLRTGTGRVTLTPEQSHHVYSQLNAIVGFAEVLLDEAGNRASGVERQEFLEHIKASGVQLVGYMNRLTEAAPGDAGPVGESAGDRVLASPPGASPVLVAAADPTVRERLEALLSRAGYRVEFAA